MVQSYRRRAPQEVYVGRTTGQPPQTALLALPKQMMGARGRGRGRKEEAGGARNVDESGDARLGRRDWKNGRELNGGQGVL